MNSKHILSGMISDGLSFPLRTPELISALEKMLRLKGKLDYSLHGVEKVDEAVRRLFTPVQRSEPHVFLPIVGYVTELGRRLVHGRYEMRIGRDGITWEPWVVGSDGKEYEFFTLAYRELCDYSDESGSLRGALVGWIRADTLAPMVEASTMQLNESDGLSQSSSYYGKLFQLDSRADQAGRKEGPRGSPPDESVKSSKKRSGVDRRASELEREEE